MRIAVWNMNGNVGKSTFANKVMHPRLAKDAEIIYVESDNTVPGKIVGSKEFEANANDWAELTEYLSANVVGHDIVVDIGSTDSKKVKALFVEFEGSLDEFDLFVVPHSPDGKQDDTALTIDFLQAKGIPAEKIKLIFNNVPIDSKIEKIFADLFDYHTKSNNFILVKNAVISKTSLFDRLNGSDLTIESILLDDADWQQKIIDAHPKKDDPEVKEAITYYSWMKTNKMLAKRLSTEFDSVFKIIMGK